MTPRSDLPPMSEKIKTALFAGSFNPFTRGHLRIVERALSVADKVIVAIGFNADKIPEERKDSFISEIDARKREIEKATAFLNKPFEPSRVVIESYSGLTADFAKRMKADFLIRGIRNVADFEYERNLADINLKVLGIDTLLFCAEPEYGYLSSSAVRELKANGFDTTPLLP